MNTTGLDPLAQLLRKTYHEIPRESGYAWSDYAWSRVAEIARDHIASAIEAEDRRIVDGPFAKGVPLTPHDAMRHAARIARRT